MVATAPSPGACAGVLKTALRSPTEDFARHLGVAPRTRTGMRDRGDFKRINRVQAELDAAVCVAPDLDAGA